MLGKRLWALEAARTEPVVHLSPTEREKAEDWYEMTLHAPEQADPLAVAYWATVALPQIAFDYDAMLKGAPAPWLP